MGVRVSRCPEAEYRASLPEGEFWDYVLNGRVPGEPDPDLSWLPGYEPGPLADTDEQIGTANPCPVCGTPGTCGYDDQGRPFVHADTERTDR